MKRTVFFISDGTGITAEMLGHSLLTQFEALTICPITIPYIDTTEKAEKTVGLINRAQEKDGVKPLVFATLIDQDLHRVIAKGNGQLFDLFNTFIQPLEKTLDMKSSYRVGRSHAMVDYDAYKARIDAINYALSNDDGIGTHNYHKADVIILGVSRSGKTPTCLYLALQYGIFAANFPLTEEELENDHLSNELKSYKDKCFGLTIEPQRLQSIRSERRPNGRYSQADQCRKEVRMVESLYQRENIPFIDTTQFSIEEIATRLLAITEIPRRIF